MSPLRQDLETAITQDGYDRMAFAQAAADVDELGELARRSASSDALLSDVHAALFKIRPQVDENSSAPHREVLEQLMDTKEYSRLRASTRMDELASAFGTLELGAALVRELPEDPPENENGDPEQATLPGCEDRDAQRRRLRAMVAEAAQATEDQTEAVRALVGTVAGHGEGRRESMNLGDAVKLAKALRENDKLKKIAKLAGRLRQVASGKRKTRYKKGPDDVVDVELGNDLGSVLPSELQALVTPELETLTMLRYVERRLLQTKRQTIESVDQGPMVIVVDESASMKCPSGCEISREIWAKAVTLALLGVAKKEKRDFALIGFNSSVRIQCWGNTPRDTDLLEWLSRSASGGTDFGGALREALSVIESPDGRFAAADVILITDGDDALDSVFVQEWRDRAKASGAHLYVVYVQTTKTTFDGISDGSARLQDLSEDDQALDLVFGV